MNFPGKECGYWEWRFEWSQVLPQQGQLLLQMTRLYRRDAEHAA
jgi:4-alpha-glucanotransferase